MKSNAMLWKNEPRIVIIALLVF